MKALIFLGIFVACVFAQKSVNPLCPDASGIITTCVFIQGYNCVDDSECTSGKLCCPHGCGKICKDQTTRPVAAGTCPKSSGLAGICIFRSGYNCLHDDECDSGELCCAEGCGKICKHAVKVTKRDVVHTGSCPNHLPSHPMFGLCVYRPGYNCLSDSECAQDEKCCHEGCGRICKKAV